VFDRPQPFASSPCKVMAGMDERYADCILVSREGTKHHSLQGMLAAKSPVFKDMFEACRPSTFGTHVPACPDEGPPTSGPRKGKGKRKHPDVLGVDPVELVLDDSDAELRALTEHLHGDRCIMLDICLPNVNVDADATQALKCLTAVVFKYNMQGERDLTTLSSPSKTGHQC
jgi:hypothetical protein